MKTKILALLFVLFALYGQSQNSIEWDNTIGGSGYDWLQSIHQTPDGGYILGGYSQSNISGEKTENRRGNDDYWVIKLNAIGNIEWQKTIGGDTVDQLFSIYPCTDSGYILGGWSVSNISGEKTENRSAFGDYWVVKLDSSGNIQWQNTIGGNSFEVLSSVQQTSDGGYILGGYSQSNISGDKTENSKGERDYWIIKLNPTGTIQWQKTIGGNTADFLYSIQQTTDGGYILGGTSSSGISGDKTEGLSGVSDYWVVKVNATGTVQWDNTIGGSGADELRSVSQTTDGGYILGGYSKSNISGDKSENSSGADDFWVVKLNASGNIQWQNTIGGDTTDQLYSVEQTADGGYILGGYSMSDISGDKTENTLGTADYWIVKLDASGNIQLQNTISGGSDERFSSIEETADGGFIVGGTSSTTVNIVGDKTELGYGQYDYWVVKLRRTTNQIQGNVFIDLNNDCNLDGGEYPYSQFLLKLEPWQDYTSTDNLGNYTFYVDLGSYTVSPLTQNPYITLQCPSSGVRNASFSTMGNISSDNNFGFEITTNCPLMEVDISTSYLRRCKESTYTVQYCNHGTIVANNAQVEIQIPWFITVNSSSIPWSIPQSGSTYVFNLGNVGIGECGTFTIDIMVTCSCTIGLTHCVEAHIYPDTICEPDSPGWDHSSVQVEALCVNDDTVQFRISNVGTGDMQDSLQYYIVEDNVMLRIKNFMLASGQSVRPYELANGSTYRIEAQQSPGHPGKSKPSATVEACGTNSTGSFSLGFVTQFEQDDQDPFISIDCQENISSYDPNDKIGFPKGIGAERIISSTTELDYKIRFQNTGTDTAFTIIIRDTLSPYLNLATVVPGASSHPYDNFRIYGSGILEWTFSNILLPDSNVNEPASHGFVKFRVAQVSNNPEGTVIENSADIYFDFNDPVTTNVEFNTVGDVYKALLTAVENLDLNNNISVYPNPFSQYLIVEIEENHARLTQFEVYDLQGRLIKAYPFSGSKKIRLSASELQSGFYIYKVIADKQTIGAGKIIRY